MSRLSPPEESLKASVVVPARNEEALIGACLRALALQENVAPEEYEVILVLDACTDATERRTREVHSAHPGLRLHFLDGPGKGAGHARRAGMEAACERLLRLGKPSGLIASTDADTVVAPDWLSTQLDYAATGAQAIGGRIELADETNLPEEVSGWHRQQGNARHRDLLTSDNTLCSNILEHWQFSGASLSLTAAVYEDIGGLEPLTALEDEYLERVLRQRGVPIERPLSVRVRTSARRNGRAERGLAQDLALATWFRDNTYRGSDYDLERVLRAKNRTVSLILTDGEYGPETLAAIEKLRHTGVLDEVVVLSSRSQDGGLPPSFEVYRAEELMPRFGPVRGHGDLVWRGVSVARGEVVLMLDPVRYENLQERVCGLLGPLVEREDLTMVKGFHTPPDGLTDLLARPLINIYFPRLAGFAGPLSKDVAARRDLLRRLAFPVGYGLDISLLLDAAERAGVETLAQTGFGDRSASPTGDDSDRSHAILAAAATRMPHAARQQPIPGAHFRPGIGGLTTQRVPVEERPPLESLAAVPYVEQDRLA